MFSFPQHQGFPDIFFVVLNFRASRFLILEYKNTLLKKLIIESSPLGCSDL